MSVPMDKLKEAVFNVLKNDAGIIAQVPGENIRPLEDPIEPDAGNVIFYGWAGGRWQRKQRRGEGAFSVSVGAVKNHAEAAAILDLVRELLTPVALSYSGSPVRVALFAEEDATSDTGTTASGRYLSAASFSVKFVEAA